MHVTIEEMASKLRACKEVCIVYHIRPDGDCIGSSFALMLALQSLGIRCAVKGTDPVPKVQQYLTDQTTPDQLENPVYCAVDAASPARTGSFAEQQFLFCIDHHRNNSIEATYQYVEEDCGACSEIIFKLIQALDVPITTTIANLLYMALVTDTMCFRTADTSPQSFETAAALARFGADLFYIGRRHAFIKSKGRLKIEDILRSSFHFSCDNRILTGIITLKDLETADILDSELEGINSFVEQVEGVRIGVTVRELPNGKNRCSVRTNGDIYANEICAYHGGGGHLHAACCELTMTPDQARHVMEETCAMFLG